MRSLGLLFALSGLIGGGLALEGNLYRRAGPQNATAPNDAAVVIAPKRYIVEFAEGINPASAANDLARSGITVLKVFDSAVFSGAAVESDAENIDSLQARGPVFQAWQSKKIALSPSATPLKFYSEAASAANYSVHGMTGVDKLHAAGITGNGVTVAVVDTGVNYNHPALGGGFGPGFKISGGYDLVGNGQWPDNGESKVPGPDPMDFQGHGTHVSGIIAGSGGFFQGVAPDANLLMYKVFTQSDNTDDYTLIDAFIMARDAGADIITSSIGGLDGWTNGAWALVASRLVDEGIVVTIAAGNSGRDGALVASSGSSGEHVLAVASVEAAVYPANSFRGTFALAGDSNTTNIAYVSSGDWPTEIRDWPVVPLSLDGTDDEACAPLAGETRDFSNTIVLVRAATCDFATQQENLAPYHAAYIIFYADALPITVPVTTFNDSLIAMIMPDAGAAILGTVKEGGSVVADFTYSAEAVVSVPTPLGAGVMSYFTSIGPTNELFIKPDIAAPGGDILSTWLDNRWGVLSGTSMACPYVAGVAALYISQNGGRSVHGPDFAKTLAMRIIGSGNALRWDDGTGQGDYPGFFAPVPQAGTGLIDAVKVVNYKTDLSFAKFNLNDTHHFSRYHSVDITNTDTVPVTYTFSVQDFGGFEIMTKDPSDWSAPRMLYFWEMMSRPFKAVPAVSFPSGTFTVKPGQTKTAKFSFQSPGGLNSSNLPIYNGKVVVTGSNGESLGIPYMGLAADLHNEVVTMFPYQYGVPSLTSTRSYIHIEEKANFTFDLALYVQDFPSIYTFLTFPTTELRFDIFEADWKERDWAYPPVVGQKKFVGSATYYPHDWTKFFFDPEFDNENDVASFPATYVPRTPPSAFGYEFWWLGQLANRTLIAPGKYQMRFAALVPFGNPQNANNWDVFKTPQIEILPRPK